MSKQINELIDIIIKNKDKSLDDIIDKYIKNDKMKVLNELVKELSKQGYEIISTNPLIIKKSI